MDGCRGRLGPLFVGRRPTWACAPGVGKPARSQASIAGGRCGRREKELACGATASAAAGARGRCGVRRRQVGPGALAGERGRAVRGVERGRGDALAAWEQAGACRPGVRAGRSGRGELGRAGGSGPSERGVSWAGERKGRLGCCWAGAGRERVGLVSGGWAGLV